ncbi:hypothetical protein BJ912DRAFT_934615 [Pholiota molesta]|nr:hypothetical protein BJ912DRAFT_934615 [Pholiota molesta]
MAVLSGRDIRQHHMIWITDNVQCAVAYGATKFGGGGPEGTVGAPGAAVRGGGNGWWAPVLGGPGMWWVGWGTRDICAGGTRCTAGGRGTGDMVGPGADVAARHRGCMVGLGWAPGGGGTRDVRDVQQAGGGPREYFVGPGMYSGWAGGPRIYCGPQCSSSGAGGLWGYMAGPGADLAGGGTGYMGS